MKVLQMISNMYVCVCKHIENVYHKYMNEPWIKPQRAMGLAHSIGPPTAQAVLHAKYTHFTVTCNTVTDSDTGEGMRLYMNH